MKITEKLSNAGMNTLTKIQDSPNVYYIKIPYLNLFIALMKLNVILFFLVLISVNLMVAAIITPAWLIMAYIYYIFWKAIKTYKFRFISVLACILVTGIPFCAMAVVIRCSVIHLLGG